MEQKPVFKGVFQVGLVVKDCMGTLKKYNDDYGIGPWNIYEMGPDSVTDMIIRDKPETYAMRAAVAMVGDVMIELIEPLDDKSIYAEWLKEHGDGIHHILFDVDDPDKTVDFFKGKGIGTLQGGNNGAITYTYFDTIKELGLISEILKETGDGEVVGEPDDVYPRPE
jgi:methylmalonyl-CoA/ethylmalonyl-CoA epimerase